jgi:hypothetical protein
MTTTNDRAVHEPWPDFLRALACVRSQRAAHTSVLSHLKISTPKHSLFGDFNMKKIADTHMVLISMVILKTLKNDEDFINGTLKIGLFINFHTKEFISLKKFEISTLLIVWLHFALCTLPTLLNTLNDDLSSD